MVWTPFVEVFQPNPQGLTGHNQATVQTLTNKIYALWTVSEVETDTDTVNSAASYGQWALI